MKAKLKVGLLRLWIVFAACYFFYTVDSFQKAIAQAEGNTGTKGQLSAFVRISGADGSVTGVFSFHAKCHSRSQTAPGGAVSNGKL